MEVALQYDLHACTDITGFGILGHLLEVAHGCNARVVLEYKKLPFYADALAMYKKGETTGSNKPNRAMVQKHHLDIQISLSSHEEELLYDPQTSGGLLLSLPGSQADELIAALTAANVQTAVKIGEIVSDSVGIIVV
jgi:selenide,water dikinase